VMVARLYPPDAADSVPVKPGAKAMVKVSM